MHWMPASRHATVRFANELSSRYLDEQARLEEAVPQQAARAYPDACAALRDATGTRQRRSRETRNPAYGPVAALDGGLPQLLLGVAEDLGLPPAAQDGVLTFAGWAAAEPIQAENWLRGNTVPRAGQPIILGQPIVPPQGDIAGRGSQLTGMRMRSRARLSSYFIICITIQCLASRIIIRIHFLFIITRHQTFTRIHEWRISILTFRMWFVFMY